MKLVWLNAAMVVVAVGATLASLGPELQAVPGPQLSSLHAGKCQNCRDSTTMLCVTPMNNCIYAGPFFPVWIQTTGTLATAVECYDVTATQNGYTNCATMIPMTCTTTSVCDTDCMNCTKWFDTPADTMCVADGDSCMGPMS